MNSAQTYFLIGKCLALDFFENHRQSVVDAFKYYRVDIEKFVKIADSHLVLQSVYPKIEKHNLINDIPEELTCHLKHIYELNSLRNAKILSQVKILNSMLKPEGIFPLYLKGTGNILDDLYDNPGERILHDIDLLVEHKDFEKTATVLQDHGFQAKSVFNSDSINYAKHYPILYSEKFPAFVEIHRLPVRIEYTKKFTPESVFMERIKLKNDPDCYVMSYEHRIIHTFIHSQLEDKGHLYARSSLRNLYDVLLLSKHADPEQVLFDFGYYRRISTGFLDIMYKSFGTRPLSRLTPVFYLHLQSLRFQLNLRSRFINLFSTLMLRMVLSYMIRPIKAVTDKNLRYTLIQKLHTRKWYARHFSWYCNIFRRYNLRK